MKTRKSHFIINANSIVFASIILILASCDTKTELSEIYSINSPDGDLRLNVHGLDSGGVQYSVMFKDSIVIEESPLGLELKSGDYFNTLKLIDVSDQEEVSDTYELLHGKRRINRYNANEQLFFCTNENGDPLNILFHVSNDGVAFKYIFPDSSKQEHSILEEKTGYKFPAGTKAWLQPMAVAKTGWNQTNPSYEENYSVKIDASQPPSVPAGWVYPALFNSGEAWILITEGGLGTDYCGTRLSYYKGTNTYQVTFPPVEEGIFDGQVKPVSPSTPWATPWRIIAIGTAGNLIESNLGNAYADEAIDTETDNIIPGLASWSWAILKDESITYDVQKQFIDFAADMKWPYCLIDVNWDTTIGYDRIQELSNYAASRNVGLLLWYNSAGDWNTVPYHPKDKLLTHDSREAEFSRLKEMGIKGIKVDFFGGDGQSVIKYYHEMLRDAAAHGLLVNFHGTTLPRGWHRTYPNLMTMESVKGFEFITFEQGNADLAPEHCALLPFTRNAFDPMDFTPMNLSGIPNIDRRTSRAFELALPTLFLSGIQHIAETPDVIEQVPDYVISYLQDIPVQWDDTRFLGGYPAEYVMVARRRGSEWFIAGINALDKPVTLECDLSFAAGSSGFQITDGGDNGFTYNPVDITNEKNYQVTLQPKGGIVMKLAGNE